MPKRNSQPGYYSGPAGSRDANLLRMLNARLATMTAARAALRSGDLVVPRNARLPVEQGQVIAQAEPRPHRVAQRMPLDARLKRYARGRRRLTGKQIKRLCSKAQLDETERYAMRTGQDCTHHFVMITGGMRCQKCGALLLASTIERPAQGWASDRPPSANERLRQTNVPART